MPSDVSIPTIPPCPHVPRPYAGPSRDEVLSERNRYVNPAVFTYYNEPIMIVEGYMQYLFDESGRRYLDLFGGVVTISCGHSHPKIVRRMQDQIARLQHTTTIYLHPGVTELSRRLAEKMPPGLEVTYFVNSGSEANELAINMARVSTGNTDVIALRNAYHGTSSTSLGLTALHTWRYPIPAGHNIHHAVCPDPYRSPFDGTPEEIARKSADDIRDLILHSTPGSVAAFITEPIQGMGGVTAGAAPYLEYAYEIIRSHGGLCISDEVQTGFGRTGEYFWGFEHHGVVPDIVITAKGIGNGAPLAAVTTTREIAESLTSRLHFNTFGGNPVSMAAGIAVLDVLEEDRLQENARGVGSHFRRGLEKLRDRHRLIGDVRGRGLMLGFELVTDRVTKVPAPAAADVIHESAREDGVLLGRGGLTGHVIRIKPPMCITKEDVNFALAVLDRALARAARDTTGPAKT